MADAAVCFDAMGVLYTSPDDVGELLIPFARSRGSMRSESDIRATYRRCSLGDLTSADLWRWLGVAGEAAELDAAYTTGHRKNDDVARLAASLAAQGATVACVSNDIREWSQLLRRRHGLDRDISTWIVSGEVGIRKPDDGIYQALLAATGIAPASWTFIDDREANLDAAARLGFRTIRFGAPSAAHASARDGTELAALIVGGVR
jgi:HAD superfamily hydrolase (TIGR01509 family)